MTLESATLQSSSKPKISYWIGCTLSGLITLLMGGGAIASFFFLDKVVQGMSKAGYTRNAAIGVLIAELCSAVLYAIPQTAVLGAILLTGYLGGATCHHVRSGEPFFFPPIMGVLVWLGLYLRDLRVRALIPFREKSS